MMGVMRDGERGVTTRGGMRVKLMKVLVLFCDNAKDVVHIPSYIHICTYPIISFITLKRFLKETHRNPVAFHPCKILRMNIL